MNKTLKAVIQFSLLLTLLIGLGACVGAEWKGGNDSFEEDAAKWPFRPETMRFHPFTSTEKDEKTGQFFIDAHVELLDQVEDQTKGLGTIRFELYAQSLRASADPLENTASYVWVMPINSIDRNELRYDPIMRLYKFRLALTDNLSEADSYRLKAFFVDDRGMMMETDKEITPYNPETDDDDI